MVALPVIEFGFPGPLRDTLVAAITSGMKTNTTGLWIEYQRAGDPLPLVGSLVQMIDSTLDPSPSPSRSGTAPRSSWS